MAIASWQEALDRDFPGWADPTPEGMYPLYDWADLEYDHRFAYIIEGSAPADFAQRHWGKVETLIRDAPSAKAARSALERLRAVAQDAQASLYEEALQGRQDREVSVGMERLLEADPREVEAVLRELKEGSDGFLMWSYDPIPPWTCVWVDGKARGVLPGNMSNAVTFTYPRLESNDGKGSSVSRLYSMRGFHK